MKTEIENEEVRAIPQEKYDLLVWTDHEKLFRDRIISRNKILAEIVIPFTVALQVKLRQSVFGTYLDDFNENQWQNEFLNMNKLAITHTTVKDFNPKQQDLFDYNNNLFDEVMKYLNNTVTETEQIDCGFLYERATHLRLDDYNVNMLDDGVRNFKNLQVLVICGNWINDIHGSILPRRLKFLELYVNEITTVENLANDAPKHLIHLGLARNKLTNNSCLHLLGQTGRFNNLKTLDLSECDIYCLVGIVQQLKLLQNLEGLLLQGNPCSMVMGYKDVVLHNLPNLIFLDGVEILKPDRTLNENFMDGAKEAELVLKCVKLTGLPKPPKTEKKIKQTIHVEFVVPLFQENTKDELDESEFDENNKPENTNDKKKGKKQKGGKSENTLKKGSKKGTKLLYDGENEFNCKKINNSFQTQRKPWGSKMKFSPVLIKSPENNLQAYRDSFRSRINVRVVYLQFLTPEKKKKKKGDKQDKKREKKGKPKNLGSEKAKTSDKHKEKNENLNKLSKADEPSIAKDDTREILETEEPEEEPKETILKKVTLANFYCDLSSPNFKDDLRFYWCDDPTFERSAVEVQSYLEKLRKESEEKIKTKEEEKVKEKDKNNDKKSKDIKKSKGKIEKSGKSASSRKSKKSKTSKKLKSIKISKKSESAGVSCQISFGLSRTGQDMKETKSFDDLKSLRKGGKEKKNKEHK